MVCNSDGNILHSAAVDWKKLRISVVCARNKYRSFFRYFFKVIYRTESIYSMHKDKLQNCFLNQFE